MSKEDVITDAKIAATALVPVGSRRTCSPAPTDTDDDYLVLLDDKTESAFHEFLADYCFVAGGSDIPDSQNNTPPEDRFQSYTLGDVNLIVTESKTFYRRFLAATSVARRLNLLNKQDRIALFQAVLYGNA